MDFVEEDDMEEDDSPEATLMVLQISGMLGKVLGVAEKDLRDASCPLTPEQKSQVCMEIARSLHMYSQTMIKNSHELDPS